MNYYVELGKKDYPELIIRLVYGCFSEESGDVFLNDEEKEKIKEIILDKTNLEDGDENNCIVSAIFYHKIDIGQISRYILGKVRVERKDRQHLIRVYLQYRAKRNSVELLDEDIRARYKQDTLFWIKYPDKLTKYISLVNGITQACCLQKFKHCKLQCQRAKQNIFVCEYCKED